MNRDLFVQEDADAFFLDQVGEPYQPSNGHEGELFMGRWCAHCTRDQAFREDPDQADGCEIIANTMAMKITDPGYPAEWVWDARGQPKCTAFEEIR